MKFLTYMQGGAQVPAVLSPDGRQAVALNALGFMHETLEQFIRAVSPEDLHALYAALPLKRGLPLESLALAAAIPEPLQEIIIMENNFTRDDAEQAAFMARRAAGEPLLPTYFYKKASLCNADGGVIPLYPGHVNELDYQAELCAVTWRDAYQVPRDEAANYIFGYTLINNVIARSLVLRHRRPYIATSLDGYLPMSPLIVTADEFAPGHRFTVRSFVNGALRQNGTTAHLRFDAAYAIADLSQASVLRGASILSLGTPYGCARDISGDGPPTYLKAGDRVTCQVEGVGSVTNIVT